MALLQLKGITLQYGSVPLLDAVDLGIQAGERVCLLGRNGSGKTSLMRILTGEETPNSGDIIRPPGLHMTRLDQEVPGDVAGTVEAVIHAGLSADRHEEEWESDHRIRLLMDAMQLPALSEFASLSGGLKRRTLLARALAGQPDLLLLDEPTNHLDLASILWLEEFLLAQRTTLFFVTHDRAFLRKLATRIVELDRGRLQSWDCDYDTYLVRKAAWLENEEKQWALFDKKMAQEEVWIRQGVKARRTRNEGRVRALEQLRRERRQRRERIGTARIEVQEGPASGQKVIELDNVSFAWPARTVLEHFSTTIWRGDKVGIIGPNGSGKTTLLQILLGRIEPQGGTVRLGTNLQVVYLDQLRDQIDDEKTVIQNVAGSAEMVTFQGRSMHILGYLQDFLFSPDRSRMPAGKLSGGERNRLLLARLFLQPANVLVLDEPTNDLDAETLELLEALLVEFSGTLLLVSHDRVFLDEVVTSTLVLEAEGVVTEVTGGYSDWEKLESRRAAAPIAMAPAGKVAGSEPEPAPPKGRPPKPRKFLNREQAELDAMPQRIERLEAAVHALAEKLADPQTYTDFPESIPAIHEEMKKIQNDIARQYARWEELEALKREFGAGRG
ncbi:MAG TPA: ATP-binding cassette domain-containing protein [Verrucomicrobiae bacterium]|nr:ATP-binding cassette domain-containing protein [Verrucomicrobiae bacterium]